MGIIVEVPQHLIAFPWLTLRGEEQLFNMSYFGLVSVMFLLCPPSGCLEVFYSMFLPFCTNTLPVH